MMTVDDSPYAGPQPLRPTDQLYGRDVELAELESLLVAQRIVLLYAVSGVGKTSLLQAGADVASPARAGLHRRVEDRFHVVHISGFSDMQPASADEVNPYIAHVHQELQASEVREPHDHPRQRRTLLIIDQFEELFTLHGTDWPDKRRFLDWLARYLHGSEVWAVIALREEYVAALKPYRHRFPGGLSTEKRLEPLGRREAAAAIIGPAASQGVVFDPRLADGLADVLSDTVELDEDGKMQRVPGEFVEPMHLQLTCQKLWEGWRDKYPDDDRLTVATAEELGLLDDVKDVSRVLAGYFDMVVVKVAAKGPTTERQIRDWFGQELITERDTRRSAEWSTGETSKASTAEERTARDAERRRVVNALEQSYLIKQSPNQRQRGVYVLSHDLVVPAVRTSNEDAFEKLGLLYTAADTWKLHGGGDKYLEIDVGELEAKAAEFPDLVSETERRFIVESARKRNRRRALVAAFGALVAVLIFGLMLVVNLRDEAGESAMEREALERLAQAVLDADANLEAALSRTVAAADAIADIVADEGLPEEFRSALHWMLARSPTLSAVRAPQGDPVRADAISSSPERQLVFVADPDLRAIGVWKVNGTWFESQPQLPGTAIGVVQLSSTRDGEHVVAVTADERALTWKRGAEGYIPQVPIMDVSLIAIRPNGGIIRVTADGATVHIEGASDPIEQIGVTTLAASDEHVAIVHESTDDSSGVSLHAAQEDMLESIPVDGMVTAVAFAPDGRRLVLGTQVGEVVVVNPNRPETFDRITPTSTHLSPIRQIAFTDAGGRRLTTIADDGEVVAWELAGDTLTSRRSISRTSSFPQAIATVRPTSQIVVRTSAGTVELWDIAVGHDGPITAIASYESNDGPVLVTGGLDGRILSWDVGQLTATAVPATYRAEPIPAVVDLAAAPGGRFAVAAWADNRLQRIPCPTVQCMTVLDSDSVIVGVEVFAEGAVIALTASGDLWAWPVGERSAALVASTGEAASHLAIVAHDAGPESVVVASGGAFLEYCSSDWREVAERPYLAAPTGLTVDAESVLVSAEGQNLERIDMAPEARDSALAYRTTIAAPGSAHGDAALGTTFRATVGIDGSVALWRPTPDSDSLWRPTPDSERARSSPWQYFADIRLPMSVSALSFFAQEDGTEHLVIGDDEGRIKVVVLSDDALLELARSRAIWAPSNVQCDSADIAWMSACSNAVTEPFGPSNAMLAAYEPIAQYVAALSTGDWDTARELRLADRDTSDASFGEAFAGVTIEAALVDGDVSGGVVRLRVLQIASEADGYRQLTCSEWLIDQADIGDHVPEPVVSASSLVGPGEDLNEDAAKADCATGILVRAGSAAEATE